MRTNSRLQVFTKKLFFWKMAGLLENGWTWNVTKTLLSTDSGWFVHPEVRIMSYQISSLGTVGISRSLISFWEHLIRKSLGVLLHTKVPGLSWASKGSSWGFNPHPLPVKKGTTMEILILVGGWTNPFETYYNSQNGFIFPKVRGENKKYSPEIYMEPENDGIQKESPFPGTSFQVPC